MREGDVEVTGVLERVAAPRRDLGNGVEHRLEVGFLERRSVHVLQVTVMPDDRRLAELQVNVARAALDRRLEDRHEVEHVLLNIGTRPLGL